MTQVADRGSAEKFAGEADAIELRIFRVMIASVAVAVTAAAMLAPWRFTAGLMLGGVLSLLNYHWLRTSVAAIFNIGIAAERPRFKASRYILRYFVIGVISFAAYKLLLVSLPATIAGLCAFVPALFVEAGRQFYFAIIHREESF
jgi:hypothetical protein